jgi:hypothetical protein
MDLTRRLVALLLAGLVNVAVGANPLPTVQFESVEWCDSTPLRPAHPADAARVTWQVSPPAQIIEWRQSRGRAIEHGLTLSALLADCPNPTLRATVALERGFQFVETDTENRLAVVDQRGRTRAHYGGLLALDARGVPLAFTRSVSGRVLSVSLSLERVQWPLSIDPILTPVGSLASNSDDCRAG